MRYNKATTMIQMIRQPVARGVLVVFAAAIGILVLGSVNVSAITPIPTPNPKPGSYGIEATKTKAPPNQGARITTPTNGASFSKSPIPVRGICPNDLLVQIYNNGVMVGAVMCKGGSFSIEVSLFPGKNELTALVYDELYQAGTVKSNKVTVTFKDTNFSAFGQQLTLTSSYGRRSAAAGSDLSWPLQLSGGTGPYAFSIDWGDNGKPELKSQSMAGVVSLAHVYDKAGIYRVNITATDVNGVTAFLQVIAVSNGKVEEAKTTEKKDSATTTKVLWIPSLAAFILLLPSYWLGRRSQVVSLRSKMLKERDAYQEK